MSNWEEYMKLPLIEKRKAVARDIVAAIKARKLVSCGWYLAVNQIVDESPICAACAIGSAYMAMFGYKSLLVEPTLGDSAKDEKVLCMDAMEKAGFERNEAQYIESVFEGPYRLGGCPDWPLHKALRVDYPDRLDRMQAL